MNTAGSHLTVQPDKLVSMANQIGRFFSTQRGDAAAATAVHIVKFWDPRMREALLDHLEACGDAGLDEVVRGAARALKPDGPVKATSP